MTFSQGLRFVFTTLHFRHCWITSWGVCSRKPFQPSLVQHSSLLGPLVSCKENEVLRIQPRGTFFTDQDPRFSKGWRCLRVKHTFAILRSSQGLNFDSKMLWNVGFRCLTESVVRWTPKYLMPKFQRLQVVSLTKTFFNVTQWRQNKLECSFWQDF